MLKISEGQEGFGQLFVLPDAREFFVLRSAWCVLRKIGIRAGGETRNYFLFCCQSQTASNAVTAQATALAQIGISKLSTVTFHWKINLNRCANETSSKNITTTIVDDFIEIFL
jgi:hypothetical protein